MFHWLLLPRVPLARKGHAASVSGKAANGCAAAARSLGGRGGLYRQADEGIGPYAGVVAFGDLARADT